MTCPDIFLCVRRTIDWKDEAAVDAELQPDFREKLELWNATFTIPYHRFRQRLKEIAQESLGRVAHAAVADLGDVPEGAIVVPVDDDDWLAPDLAARLRDTYDPAALGYVWNRYVLEARPANPLRWLTGGRGRPPDHRRFTCGTNNYAVIHTGAWSVAITGHVKASRQFDAHPDAVRHLSLWLSIQNRNLSSQTVLGWQGPALRPSRLRRRYRRHRRLYRNAALPPALAWARPYVDRMSALMAELALRRP